ncbi:TnsA endonuclease N-terminal domain-containing protein [Methylomonas sp. EFPC3]|uniref:TnsA endonuclease N-terminal domain-containing protein n=1 Tax=Methylomonas sp. EFPC3 TaxID=3021710 RepID=UPI002415E544|nr:TnsA endonuclease N-terminal domain-containing protein [Methylomonas sp. EFPC3]WFP49311.1 TnsA endonuclease N-terminal domain-containing protein [Methylomonas sp. EFPC3]
MRTIFKRIIQGAGFVRPEIRLMESNMSSNLWQGRWCGMKPAGDNHRRARNVISPSGCIVRGKFPSRKNGRMVHHEGLPERDAIYLFEASPNVVRYREQPITLEYPDGAELRRYTPDFELVLITGEIILIEVKAVSSLGHEDVQHKFNCVAEHMRRSKKPFFILTDEVIRQEPRLSNLRWVLRQAPLIRPSADAMTVAIIKLRDCLPASFAEVTALTTDSSVDPYSLLLAGYLRCSLDQPISDDTLIELNLEADNGWFYIAQEQGF